MPCLRRPTRHPRQRAHWAAPVAVCLSLCAGCAKQPSFEDYLRRQVSLYRFSVDIDREVGAVRKVLSQRKLFVDDELRGPGFAALDAESFDHRETAVRIITIRGVQVAADAASDDLFDPASVALLAEFPPRWGAYELVGFTRTAYGLDAGCVALYRVLPSGRAAPVPLDVSMFGTRACVAAVKPSERGQLDAVVAWPGLGALSVPTLRVPLVAQPVLLGKPEPLVPHFRPAAAGDWVARERARLDAVLSRATAFSQRHAVGVARAALALLSARGVDPQLAALRGAVGALAAGSLEAEVFAETEAHIKAGWSDPQAAEAGSAAVEADASEEGLVIEPEATEPEAAGREPTDLKAVQPEAAGRGPTDSKAVQPEAAGREPTDSKAVQSEAAGSEPTDPKAVQPKATDPEAAAPKATDPEAAAPKATDPESAAPKATDSEAAAPKAEDSSPGKQTR